MGWLRGGRALVSKELDASRPYLVAIAAHAFVHVASQLLEPIGGYAAFMVLTDDLEFLGLVGGLIVFSMAHGLPAQEHAERTVEFLDGLPVHRLSAYVAKVVALLVPMAALVLSMGLIKAVLLGLVAPPEVQPWGAVVWTSMVRLLALAVGLAGLGLLLSWLRGLGWGVLVIGLFTVSMFGFFYPVVRPYGVIDGLLKLEWADGAVVPAWGPVITWWAIGLVSAALSAVLFGGGSTLLLRPGSLVTRLTRGAAVGCGSLGLLGLGALSALIILFQHGERLIVDGSVQTFGSFTVMYPDDREPEALALASELPEMDAWLTEHIGSDGSTALAIEVFGASNAHAGLFLGGKIRMSLDNEPRRTLVHELAHAHHYVLRDGVNRHHNATRFFEEGMAEYYERRYLGTDADRRLAGAIWATDQADFVLLTDDRRRREVHDPDQAYALGRVFVTAVVETHGEHAPACLQRQIGELGLGDTAGMGLWYTITRGCGQRLERILERYEALLAEAAADLPPLPELTARLDRSEGELILHDDAGLDEQDLWCRFRDDSDDGRNLYRLSRVRGGTCTIRADARGGDTFQYQLGFDLPDGGGRVFGEWTAAKL